MNLQDLKARNSAERVSEALDKTDSKSSFTDDPTYWQPTVDDVGNGYAIVRFLDAPIFVDGDDALPWVRIYSHGFKGPTGKWYIENSLTTLNGNEDPVSNYNTLLWNTNIKTNRDLASAQKRRLNYISNVFVVSDPKKPECEGKVYKYKYGAKIFEKIKFAIKPPPDFPDDVAFVPYDMWKGANFKIKIRKVEKQRNYDLSEFVKTLDDDGKSWKGTAVAKSDEAIEAIWKSAYSLKTEVAPDKFKTFDELKKKLDSVIGFDTANPENKPPSELQQPKQSAKQVEAPQATRPEQKQVAQSAAEFDVPNVSTNETELFADL